MLKYKDVVLFKFDKNAYNTEILKYAHDTDTLKAVHSIDTFE